MPLLNLVTGLLRRRVQWIQAHLNFETWSEREYPQFATRGVRCSWILGVGRFVQRRAQYPSQNPLTLICHFENALVYCVFNRD
jgi:hypothetical protein